MHQVEPEILTPNRDELAYLLTEAAEIEHGLMCCYLYAAFSLKRGTAEGLTEEESAAVEGWRRVIVRVAIEEMAHLALVSNVLSAIGSSPHFLRPNFPVEPGYHPAGVVVSLAPFDRATLEHFIYLERPEGVDMPDGAGFATPLPYHRGIRPGRLVPSAQDYATVGHLYRGIRAGIVHLVDKLGERHLFAGAPASQIGSAVVSLPGLIPVTDAASAILAIDTIVEQGEGAPGHAETSHYRRFLAIRDEYVALTDKNRSFTPALPVARNPLLRKPVDPRDRVYVDNPASARVMDLGNAIYAFALRCLVRGYGNPHDSSKERQVLIDSSIDAMELLSPVAELLCRMPSSDAHPGVNAGLSFTMSRSTTAFSARSAAWPLLAERAREIAKTCAALASEVDGKLEKVATEFGRVAKELEAAPSASGHDGGTGASTPAPAMNASGAPATSGIEEAAGKKLLLRFEGKRCIHSRSCVLSAPDVFLANTPGSWLRPDAMDVESLVAVAHSCPSGAITYERTDGRPQESAPPVNVLRVRENGPLAVHAAIELEGRGAMFRATLCRCGASKNKPFCDQSHLALPFVATGEPATQPSEPLKTRGGALSITPTHNGPLAVKGNLEICSGTGRTVNRVERTHLCRCGGSSNKPFCDGTHARIGFRSG